ncbi:Palmitoyl-protein_thioesterase [Hexamita inflata]|uniref:Palmitoyl-protein_thioesterase n=1 Tax=Hexamita inflata TaxID=28002 RepID=A0ABP1JFH4_9EUKA
MILMNFVVQQQVPIVFMHSFMSYAWMMNGIISKIQKLNPDWDLINCEVGNGALDTFFMSIDQQTDELAKCINSDPRTHDGFIGVGYSNGAFLMRNYLQKYNHVKAPMLRYVSIAGPVAGFFCGVDSNCWLFRKFPKFLSKYIKSNVYGQYFQDNIGPAGFWRDPYQLDSFNANSSVLSKIDNSITINSTYKQNFMSVDRIVLFGSPRDGLIQPWQSSWFGVMNSNSEHSILNMQSRFEYVSDSFGLRTMNEQSRIRIIDTNLTHLQYMWSGKFVNEFLEPELRMEALKGWWFHQNEYKTRMDYSDYSRKV